MNRQMNETRGKTGFILLLMGMLISCFSCMDDRMGNMKKDGDVYLRVKIENPEESRVSRVASERTDRSRIEDMNIVMTEGNDIKKIIYIDANTTTISGSPDETGLVGGKLPVDDGLLQYHIAKADKVGDAIYVIANYRMATSDALASTDGDLRTYFNDGRLKTVEQLKKMRQGTRFVSGIRTSTLFGKAEPDGGADDHGGVNYTVSLKRTTAMITVEIKEDETGLKEGVRVIPRQMCLHNVPYACHIGEDNFINGTRNPDGSVDPDVIPLCEDGLVQQVAWGEIRGGDGEITVLGGHGSEDDVLPLFMFENLQGVHAADAGELDEEIGKTPAPDKINYCSYIEVEADYYYVPADGSQQYAGPIKYRLYLGSNITDDFNVKRNYHYQVTLTLKGMAGLVEDGSFDSDGTPIAGGGGASWRIESGVSSAGFIGETTNISVSGSTVQVPFVREDNKEYVIYCKEDPWESWLMTETKQSAGGLASPTSSSPAVPKQDPLTGQWYIELFAAAYTHDKWEEHDDIENWDLETWFNKGFREQNLILAEKNGSNLTTVSEITLRQWMPLPVMEPGITKPWDANLYFSRIGVYEGEMLPWGPSEYDNWNSSNLRTNNIGTFSGESTSYNAAYGFHNVVAMYATDRYGSKIFAHTDPQSAMEIAAYRAGNSTGNPSETTGKYIQMIYYGLPTKEEWIKMKQYGAEDWRFPFSATEYWTSSMLGTQSFVYDYITGTEKLVDRSEKHRARLVYHKLDSWIAPSGMP